MPWRIACEVTNARPVGEWYCYGPGHTGWATKKEARDVMNRYFEQGRFHVDDPHHGWVPAGRLDFVKVERFTA